jgi:outer membrane protein assembly factor BamB
VEGWDLRALDRETGEELWTLALPAEPLTSGTAIARDGTILVTLRDGTVVAVGEVK